MLVSINQTLPLPVPYSFVMKLEKVLWVTTAMCHRREISNLFSDMRLRCIFEPFLLSFLLDDLGNYTLLTGILIVESFNRNQLTSLQDLPSF